MTGKGAAFARFIAAGMETDSAARMAGYNLDYARKKAREPAFQALVERFRMRNERDEETRDAVDTLWTIINDVASTPLERTSAIRALIAYDRAHPEAPPSVVTIVDDIPPDCKNCPKSGTFSQPVDNSTVQSPEQPQ